MLGTVTMQHAFDAVSPVQLRRLDRIEEIFLAEGFRKVTVGELAGRLRCSRRSLYELAPSKEALFLAVLERFLARVRREGDMGARAAPPARAFEPYLMPAIESARKVSTALMRDIDGYPPARAIWDRHTQDRMEGLRVLVERCVKSGIFRGIEPRLVAEVMAASLQRISSPEFLSRAKMSYREAVSELYGLLLHGLLRDSRASDPLR